MIYLQNQLKSLKDKINLITIEHDCLKKTYLSQKNNMSSLKETCDINALQVEDYKNLIEQNNVKYNDSKQMFNEEISVMLDELSSFRKIIDDLKNKVFTEL